MSSKEMISQLGVELPTTSFGLGTFSLSSGYLRLSWIINFHLLLQSPYIVCPFYIQPHLFSISIFTKRGPKLNQICVWLGPVPPMPPSPPNVSTRTCVGSLPHWEPMWQYAVTQAIKLLWHMKELHQLAWELWKWCQLE
jgi:hypothetical protein